MTQPNRALVRKYIRQAIKVAGRAAGKTWKKGERQELITMYVRSLLSDIEAD